MIASWEDNVVYAIFHVQENSPARPLTLTGSEEVTYEIMGFDLEQNGVLGTQAAVSRNVSMMGILVQEFGR